jgi:NADH:ubiquinone oxidoreductase subunit 6 (subunit J)
MRNVANALVYLAGEWSLWLPLLAGALAIYLLLPRPKPYPWYAGALAGGLALFLGAGLLLRATELSPEVVLFYAFSALAVVGGALLVTQHHPARAALSFTIVVLSTSGLFLLLAAPFLMAATIIIYAGAIIVTFLFVLMLAQQAGLNDADARSREPAFATLTGFLLLAAMLYVLRGRPTRVVEDLLAVTDEAIAQETRKKMQDLVEPKQSDREREREDRQLFKQAETLLLACGLRDLAREARHAGDEWLLAEPIGEANEAETVQASRQALQKLRAVIADNRARIRERLTTARLPGKDEEAGPRPLLSNLSGPPPGEARREPGTGRPAMPAENAAYLGRSLFTDYLLPVEVGGLLLLVATVGAIAIAHRRERLS